MKKFLVAICTKTWHVPFLTLTYYEIDAEDEYYARHRAWSTFENDLKYKPTMKKLVEKAGIHLDNLCAGDSVEL